MPDFLETFDDTGDVAGTDFTDLSPFTQGYIQALFFTNESPGYYMTMWDTEDTQHDLEEGYMDGCLPADAGFSDLNPDTLARIHTDCRDFERKASRLLSIAYSRGYEREQAGRDFWFTRNGHGVGFWDRKELEADDLGRELSDIAKTFGETWVSFDPDDASPTGYGYVNLM